MSRWTLLFCRIDNSVSNTVGGIFQVYSSGFSRGFSLLETKLTEYSTPPKDFIGMSTSVHVAFENFKAKLLQNVYSCASCQDYAL